MIASEYQFFFKPLNNSIVTVNYIPGLFLPNWTFKGMVLVLEIDTSSNFSFE